MSKNYINFRAYILLPSPEYQQTAFSNELETIYGVNAPKYSKVA